MIKITEDLIRTVSDKAKVSPRKRTNYNFHSSDSAVFQRMLNAAEPGTYVQPHKHENPDKAEAFVILSGRVAILEFDDNGNVADYVILDSSVGIRAVEIPPGKWHSFIILKPGSVLYEAKDGPYDKNTEKKFAAWAPSEGSPEAGEFNNKIIAKLNLK